MSTITDDFNWQSGECVVVREQPAIAVYCNNSGTIIIRQERSWDSEEDTYVLVQPIFAQTLARMIMAMADGIRHRPEELGLSEEPPQASPAKSSGNAERQRRHRERKRNGVTGDERDRGVTRNAVECDTGAAVTADRSAPPLLRSL